MVSTAVLVAVGDELLSGIRREGNCARLARALHDAGWRVLRVEIVPDDLPCIVEALTRWVGKTDLLVLSGGLGPTHDDKTRYAIAEYLGCGLAVDDALYERELSRYRGASLEKPIERSRSTQGLIPVDSLGLYNPAGSALGIYFERLGTKVWSFPGVPFEFAAMAAQEIFPLLSKTTRTWRSVGIVGVPESLAAQRVADVIADERLRISILPSFGLVEFVIRGEQALVESAVRVTRERFKDDVLPEGCATLPEAVLVTGREKGLTLSCAESCTGGLVGAALTGVPGSSAVFMGSAVTYSDEAKKKLLGVKQALLDEHGAVSGPCAESMARGVLALYETSFSVAITGIAGPDGGSTEKPAGTVWFAVAWWNGDEMKSYSFVRRFEGERDLVRERAVRVALITVWRRMRERL
ncbi:MAG: nicotinamide-nucleotide amidohydrolase family protein [Synergistaceae bacterium]|nr:nicotinamide-nucleotide amidohydrolase family protein [Synergistaceae bacterium]